MESLLDAMWDGQPPDSARKTVQVYIHRLRRALGEDDRILRTSAGYALRLKDEELDASEFMRLIRAAAEAARANLVQASGLYEKALHLWRGRAFEDALQSTFVNAHARPLEELRLEALEKYALAELNLGRPARITTTLANAVLASPYAERLRGHLMLAYYRCGRQAEALAEYRSIHGHMTEELGVEPGEDLRRLHDQILRNDPTLEFARPTASIAVQHGQTVPAQLPRRTRHFTGRTRELDQLNALVSATRDDSPLIVTFSGTAGVGKTTLAIHWAHHLAARFPDGQLYVNLRGFDPGSSIRPADALRGFLSALGVAPDQIPLTVDQQTALFRTMVADRSMIVLLDNARDADQVRPVLPGSGRHIVIVTSRIHLTGLIVADDAHPVRLDVLTEQESWLLLADRLTGERLLAEADATHRIISGCARLPLALTVAAARVLVQQDVSLESLAGDLEQVQASLDALDTGELSTSVRAAFSWSYKGVPAQAARIFRLLAIHPGPTVDTMAVAHLAGLPTTHAEDALRGLAEAQLISEDAPQRYGMHDLLRHYARELLHETEPERERRDALRRLLDFYLATGYGAAIAIHPLRPSTPLPVMRNKVEPNRISVQRSGTGVVCPRVSGPLPARRARRRVGNGRPRLEDRLDVQRLRRPAI